jgi:hypothetical protein
MRVGVEGRKDTYWAIVLCRFFCVYGIAHTTNTVVHESNTIPKIQLGIQVILCLSLRALSHLFCCTSFGLLILVRCLHV